MVMKTITVTIPDDLDAKATTEAKRLGVSKSELIRRGLTAVLPDHDTGRIDDPWHQLAGFGGESLAEESGEIDRIVYDS